MTNLPQEKKLGNLSAKTVNRILSTVIVLGSIKVSLLIGIMLFPSDTPYFQFTSIKELVLDKATKSDSELRQLARLEAAKNLVQSQEDQEIVKNTADSKQAKADALQIQKELVSDMPSENNAIKDLFGASVAHAAENIPPTPDPSAAKPRTSPLIPQVKPNTNPIMQNKFQRPDSATAGTIPAPAVNNPYASSDTLDIQQEELNRREQELLALQQQMEARIAELQGLEGKIGNKVEEAGDAQKSKLKHLIDVYTNMKPRQAAQALGNLDEGVAVKILSGMKSKQAGEILSYMETGRAVVLSELLSKVLY